MINANELRVGDIVWFEDYKLCMTTEGVVRSIKATGDFTKLGNEIYEVSMIDQWGNLQTENLIDLEPIPLTPEILEKCGFNNISPNKEGTFNYWSKELDASIDCEDGNLFRYRIHEKLRTKNIVSLHQLQNLYHALTGEELNYTP